MMSFEDQDWYLLEVNPEPWAIGPVGAARKEGRIRSYVAQNAQVRSFQEAVKDELRYQAKMRSGDLSLTCYFWRQQDDYETESGKRHRKHQADATNMLKSTEDALQGILFDNDRSNLHTQAYVVEQGKDVNGMIVICLASYIPPKLPHPIQLSVELTKLNKPEVKPFIEDDRGSVNDVF